jgi:uncharacterized OsmC-like protein
MFIEMERLKATYDSRREHAERDPAFAKVAIRAKVTLLGNVHSQAEAHGFKFDSDELPEAGGSGAGPIPLDYFLAGFGFCFLSIMARTAASLGVELEAASFSVRGLLDRRGAYGTPDVYSGFKDISYELGLESTEPVEEIWRLVREVERRCPAHATLEKATTLTQRVVLNGVRIDDGGFRKASGGNA